MTEMSRPENAGVSTRETTIAVADLARAVMTEVAPQDLAYFELVTAEWEKGNVAGQRSWTGGSVGSGVPPSLLADVIYPLLTGTIAQVLGAAGFARLQRRRRWRRKKLPAQPVQISLTASQMDTARDACIAQAMTLGLSQPEAALLADAMYGALRRAADSDAR